MRPSFLRVALLGNTSNRRFFYPREKRRTKENVALLRRAEQNLDRFWYAVHQYIDANCEYFRDTAVEKLLASGKRVL